MEISKNDATKKQSFSPEMGREPSRGLISSSALCQLVQELLDPGACGFSMSGASVIEGCGVRADVDRLPLTVVLVMGTLPLPEL
jgi:hypothetical protein